MEVNRALIKMGTAGAVLAIVCRATPLLVNTLGALGLAAWIPKADYVLLPALLICLGLLGVGVYRRWTTVQPYCDPGQEERS